MNPDDLVVTWYWESIDTVYTHSNKKLRFFLLCKKYRFDYNILFLKQLGCLLKKINMQVNSFSNSVR